MEAVHDGTEAPAMTDGHSGGHNVKVEEVLNTTKYSYLYVSENDEKFWIAVPRMEVEIGGIYHYTGGLLKKNFESKEYNRVFETIYLVSNLHSHSGDSGTPVAHEAGDQGAVIQQIQAHIQRDPGSDGGTRGQGHDQQVALIRRALEGEGQRLAKAPALYTQ